MSSYIDGLTFSSFPLLVYKHSKKWYICATLLKKDAVFPNCEVIGIPALEAVRKGGALNCISWNVKDTGAIPVELYRYMQFERKSE